MTARQWGFLHSKPKTWDLNRLQQLQREREPLLLPDLEAGQYLVDAMFKMGPTISTGMDEVAADWITIDAFARGTCRISEPWEFEALFEMCTAYYQGWRAGAEPLAMSPVEIAAAAVSQPEPDPA